MIRRWLTGALALSMTCTVALAAAPAAAQSGLDWLTAATQPRCGTPDRAAREQLFGFPFDPSDCSATETNPTDEYDPEALYEIPVVVHILMDDSCTQGVVSDELVHSQIEILNEDFLALPGTNGENGTDAQIQFVLASEDPDGNPTDGITRDCNTTWFNDGGSYWNELAWDPHNYLNIYTNTAQGFLGYVPFLPADGGGGQVGQPHDRVVILWEAFGRDAPIGPPYDQGRTATHEVGHYLGLEHTFTPGGQCGSAEPPACYSDGDLICDTAVESSPRFGCPGGAQSCGSLDPIDNYMDYSDDLCMEQFTLEQMRRNRCTLQFYRPELYNVVEPGGPVLVFDPTSLDFGDVEVGSSSAPQTVALTNGGDADATGLELTLTGDAFSADTSDCGSVLDPAASCEISVIFAPSAEGAAEGELSAAADEGASAVVELGGNGIPGTEPTAACVWDTTLGNPGGSLNALGLWDDALYVGGSPGTPFNGVDNGVAVVDLATDDTSPLGTTELTDGFVTSLVPYDDGDGERMFIVGAFNGIIFDGTELPDSRGVVAWDGSVTTTLPDSPFAEPLVFAQAATVYDGRLVIGGAGGAVDPPQKPVLTLWDGAEWTTFREEFTGLVAPVILAVEEFQGDLYFGGRFGTIEYPSGNVVESMNVMGFDGENFFSVGGGVERASSPISQVLALETFDDGTGEALYLGGRFDSSVDGDPMFAVAKWDGSELTAVGDGFPMPTEVRGFEVYDNGGGPALYAVGNFTQDTAGQPIRRIAKLEDGEWIELAGGAAENPNRALSLPDGSLGFAGNFTEVGDSGVPGSGPSAGFAQISCLANLTVSPTSHDFGTLDPDETAGALFTVTNQTDADVTLGMAATGGDAEFSVGDTDACSGTVLAGGASCQVEVVFDPAGTVGSFSGSLQVPSDANSVLATLTGSAEDVEPEGPVADVSPDSFAFQVAQGGGDSDTLNIGNLGDAELTWDVEEAEVSFAAPVVPPGMPYTYDLAWTPELRAPVGGSRASAAARGTESVDDNGARSEAAGRGGLVH